MTNDALKKQGDDGAIGWQGEGSVALGASHLGVYQLPLRDPPLGEIAVYHVAVGMNAIGWGFGRRVKIGTSQGYGWAGKPLPSTVFEIAVKAGPLTRRRGQASVDQEGKVTPRPAPSSFFRSPRSVGRRRPSIDQRPRHVPEEAPMRLLTLTAAALLLAAPLTCADDRKPPPDADAQAKAEMMIKNLFKEDFSRRKPADLQALAVKLVQQAADAGADPTARFVLLRLAAEVAAKGGDAADALQAIDAQAKEYAVNAVALKAKALEATLRATGAPIDYQAVLDAALPAADETQAADDFDSEARLLRTAQVAATKLGNKPLAAVASERGKMVEAMQKEHENIKADLATLKDKPDDPDASLHVGRFLCFYKGDWDRRPAAAGRGRRRQAARTWPRWTSTPPRRRPTRRRWPTPGWRRPTRKRGSRCSRSSCTPTTGTSRPRPQLTGLDQAKVEKKIKDLDKIAEKLTVPDAPPEPGWVVLFRSANPALWDPATEQVGQNGYALPLSKAPDGVQVPQAQVRRHQSLRHHPHDERRPEEAERRRRDRLAGGQ